MNLDNYDDTDLAIDDDRGIAGFEIAYGSSNKTQIKKTARQKGRARHRVVLLKEKRYLDRQIDTLSDYWN